MDRNAAKVVILDVRSQLRKKLEPFQLIMDTVRTLEIDDVFDLHTPFKPTPLFGVLKMKGFAGKAEQVGQEHWVSTFVNKKNRHWLNEPSSDEETVDVPNARHAQTSQAGQDRIGVECPNATLLDNRGLEPPKPMIRTLAALDKCGPGEEVVIHNDRVPMFLIEELRELGYPYEVAEQPDGSAKVRIRKS